MRLVEITAGRVPGSRSAVAVALAIILIGSGTLVGHAAWNAQTSKSATATAGSIGLTLSGVGGLTSNYKSNSLEKTAAVTVTNTGSVPLSYDLSIANATEPLASTIELRIWKQVADCNAVPVGTPVGTLAVPPPLPAGATSADGYVAIVLCVRTSLTGGHANSLGLSISPELTITGAVGTQWTAASAGQFTQAVTHTWYRIVHNGNCVQGNGAGSLLTVVSCSPSISVNNQAWRFVAIAGGGSQIVSGVDPTQVWHVDNGNKKEIRLETSSADSLQKWTLSGSQGNYVFTNGGNSRSVQLVGNNLQLLFWDSTAVFSLIELP